MVMQRLLPTGVCQQMGEWAAGAHWLLEAASTVG